MKKAVCDAGVIRRVGKHGNRSYHASMSDPIDVILDRYRAQPGPLLQVLHAIQAELGYIPEQAVPQIAAGLNLSRAEVHGVISFYHYFRRTPPGRYVVQVCRAEACQSMHSEQLIAHIRNRLQIDFHETTPDGAFSLEPVYCLGNCACSPAMMIDGELYGRVSPASFDAVVAARERKS